MSKLIIGIHGKALSGKDTLANALYVDHEFTQTAFASRLKEAAAAAFGVDIRLFSTQEGKRTTHPVWGTTLRVLLQDFGESMCQLYGESFWVKRWYMDVQKLLQTDDIVVSDVRKDVEADFLRQMGGIIVHLSRDGAGLSGAEGQHKTELGITQRPGDILLDNNGSLAQLRMNARRLVEHARERRNGS